MLTECFDDWFVKKSDHLNTFELQAVRDILHIQEQLLYHGLKIGTIKFGKSTPKIESRKILQSYCPKFISKLTSLDVSPYSENDVTSWMTFEFMNELAIAVKAPSLNSIPTLPAKTETSQTANNSAQSVQSDLPVVTPQDFLNLFPDDLDDGKIETFEAQSIEQCIITKFKLQCASTARYMLQQMINVGLFERSVGLGPVHLRLNGDIQQETHLLKAVLPHPIDDTISAASMMSWMKICLLQSSDLTLNEAALVVLCRRFCLFPLTKISRLHNESQEYARATIMTEILGVVLRYLARVHPASVKDKSVNNDKTKDSSRNVSGAQISSKDKLPHGERNSQDLQSGKPTRVSASTIHSVDGPTLRERLVDLYINPWIRTFVMHYGTIFDTVMRQTLFEGRNVSEFDAAAILEKITVLKKSGLASFNMKNLTTQWLKLIWENYRVRYSLSPRDRQSIVTVYSDEIENTHSLKPETGHVKAPTKASYLSLDFICVEYKRMYHSKDGMRLASSDNDSPLNWVRILQSSG